MLPNSYLGRLVQEVKLKELQGGNKVLNNRLAIKITKEKTTYIDIVAWGTTAEFISRYFKEGYEILFSGILINNKKKRKDVEFEGVVIQVEKVYFTYGNPREFNIDNIDNDIPDFLK